ncbi:DNA-3-methyladenine glycosylase 1 [Cannabis sativa]|uniref:DNA-3-methyladenine glycosylase 1 n=1 Tax=Cannabis sativa TaxID=3483 RepID=UPI0029CA6030|nr:DNA-3-methyladenine glycosylase 1 [Cannabis sativa]XP_060970556.1 DNA-3-methyladenine glycosylase 1 [Cannabis sativa]
MVKRAKVQSQTETQPEMATAIISKNPPNFSKIPFRARKARKLSSKSPTVQVSVSVNENPPLKLSSVLPQTLKPLTSKPEIEIALNYLRSSDPLLATLIDTHPPPEFKSDSLPFQSLSRSIIYQQLAYKAANSIYTRFVTLCGGESLVIPDSVSSLSAIQLREAGVSGRKASYLHDLAEKFRNGCLSDSSILEMDDESLLRMLTMVKGIGVWTVHMFMIFSLQRPDVLPVGDLGVRKGVQRLYGLKEVPRPLEMEKLCEKWKPYRTVGAWYMWRLMDPPKSNTHHISSIT